MVARTAEITGPERLGIGSDLCQDRPDSAVAWMREGRLTRVRSAEGDPAAAPRFPPMPDWFRDNRDFRNIARGLREAGFDADETAGILGENWLRFFADGFGPAP